MYTVSYCEIWNIVMQWSEGNGVVSLWASTNNSCALHHISPNPSTSSPIQRNWKDFNTVFPRKVIKSYILKIVYRVQSLYNWQKWLKTNFVQDLEMKTAVNQTVPWNKLCRSSPNARKYILHESSLLSATEQRMYGSMLCSIVWHGLFESTERYL